MLRGAQKQMIVIRTHDSRLFEEAYFVVRKPRTGRPACKEDMLWEANRIIERSIASAPTASRCRPESPSENDVLPDNAATDENDSLRRRHGTGRLSLPKRIAATRWVWFLLGLLCGGGAMSLLRLIP